MVRQNKKEKTRLKADCLMKKEILLSPLSLSLSGKEREMREMIYVPLNLCCQSISSYNIHLIEIFIMACIVFLTIIMVISESFTKVNLEF